MGNRSRSNSSVATNAPQTIQLKDVGVHEFFSVKWPPTERTVFLRCGQGRGDDVPLFDNIGVPCIARKLTAPVYPLTDEEAKPFFK